MPDRSSFRVEGLDMVPKLLRQLGDEFAPKVLRSIFLDAGTVVRDEAMRRAPVDSGRLAHMIGRSSGARSGQVFMKIAAVMISKKTIERNLKRKAEGKLKGIVLTDSPYYDRFQEYGTRFHKAQPFLRPAFDAKAEEFVLRVRDSTGERVDKFLARQAKKKK